MNNITKLNPEKCTGCGACNNVCPNGAISMQENIEGFLYPVVDNSKCNQCGLCSKVCACINPTYNNSAKPKCYTYMAETKIRLHSSSGGAFYELAKDFINNGGYVAGVVFNNGYNAEHIVTDNMNDIEKMRGSKYLQSDTKHCFKEIRNLLNDNKKVLFTGCPCQVAGLKSYLDKDYKNLFCVEIICHGVPSPKVFRKYIEEEFLNNNNETWIHTDFRDKSTGWQRYSITTNTDKRKISLLANKDIYIQAFLKNITLRQCCYNCQFSKLPRQGDITIGDFWGVKAYNPKYDDNIGTSVILINNNKGKTLKRILKPNAKLLKELPLSCAIKGNPNLISSSQYSPSRIEFFKNIDNIQLRENIDRILYNKCDVTVLNFWHCVNYGAILTAFGLQCMLEKLGKTVKHINYTPDFSKTLKYKNSFSEKFASKYLKLTTPCKNYKDFESLNQSCNTFIVGSDQVWEPSIIKTHHKNTTKSTYLLDFVQSDKRKLSYAASLGDFKEKVTNDDIMLYKHFLKQFDDISVREQYGKDVLNEYFNIEAELLIDGAFHIPKEILESMTEQYPMDEQYLLFVRLPYTADDDELNIAKEISSKLNVKLIAPEFNQKMPVEKWLSLIKNAKYVITSSYHTVVFSIIFNVPFAQIQNNSAQNRFDNLMKTLNTECYVINKTETYDIDKIFADKNWQEINSNIEREKEKAEIWMKNALEKTIKNKSEYDTTNHLFIKMQLAQTEYRGKIKLLAQKDKIKFDYHKSRILSYITFGEKRKIYKKEYKNKKELLKKINMLEK